MKFYFFNNTIIINIFVIICYIFQSTQLFNYLEQFVVYINENISNTTHFLLQNLFY